MDLKNFKKKKALFFFWLNINPVPSRKSQANFLRMERQNERNHSGEITDFCQQTSHGLFL